VALWAKSESGESKQARDHEREADNEQHLSTDAGPTKEYGNEPEDEERDADVDATPRWMFGRWAKARLHKARPIF